MRTFEEAFADARQESAFSNGSMWDHWADRWCYRCTKDSVEMVERGEGCPLIMVALTGRTPLEWTAASEQDRIFGSYHCSEFVERRDDGDDRPVEPPPHPVVDGQVDIFEVLTDQAVQQFQQQREVACV